jgi:hypothetical protein
MPGSGKPDDVIAAAGIDADHIAVTARGTLSRARTETQEQR